jgi:hypothetical protein
MGESLLGALIASAEHRASRTHAPGHGSSSSSSSCDDVGYEASAESYLVVDGNHALRKLMRWRQLMPRVKPFFGQSLYIDR